jgi:diguanylate cyclase (GGDEF)-like protein/PAS domain S-box-containing protein
MRPVHWILVGIAGVLASSVAIERDDRLWGIWLVGGCILAAGAVLAGARLNRTRERRPWYFIAGAIGLVAAAELSFLVGDGGALDLTYPWVSDFLRLAAYPLFAAGLAVFVRRRTPAADWGAILDAAVVAVGLGSVLWAVVLEPVSSDGAVSPEAMAVSAAFVVSGIGLIALVVRLAVTTGLVVTANAFIAAAVGLQIVGDSLYVVARMDGWYAPVGAIDVVRVVVPLLWAGAALDPSMLQLTRLVEEPESWPIRRRIALLGCAVLATVGTVVAGTVHGAGSLSFVTVGAVTLVLLLVSARLGTVVVSIERSVTRADVLQLGAAALVAAQSRDEIRAVALKTAQKLSGGRREAFVAVELAARPDLALEDAAVVGGGEIAIEVRGEIRRRGSLGRIGTAKTFVAPVVQRDRLRGVIRVTGVKPLAWHVHQGLGTLASQTALALESVELVEDQAERRSEARFRTLVQNSTDIIAVLEQDLVVRYVTPSVRTMLGYEPSGLVGTSFATLLDPAELPDVHRHLADESTPQGVLEAELHLTHADGSRRAVECVISDLRGDPSVKGIVLTAHDVTDRRQLQDRLTHQAFHDALTGLPNRVLLVDHVAHALERSKRSGADVTLLFLDLDDFKTINDSLGHSAGDELLVEIGERLRHGLRSADTPSRLGGDEFALLLEDAQGVEGAGRAAERLLEHLARPITLGETDVQIRASIGIAVAQPGQTPDELLRNADVAMYWAKRRGGHGYQLFEPQMHEAAITRLELKSDLARAFAADELTLVYQPIVDLQDDETVALEALLRWTHPARGPISPAEFVPLAEETGLINDIGRWVIRQACRDLRHWQVSIPGRARLSANVNLSARQVLQPSFREDVLQILVDTGVEPTDLVLEITESTLLEDVEGVSARLAELREIGIRIAIDDFGTGFSSLGYLQRFPVDELKIAKEFVDEVVDPRRARLVEAIVTLARSLDLRTVAEGIEHEQQGERLRQLGCELGQGYLFSRPVPAGEVPSLLRGVMSSAA